MKLLIAFLIVPMIAFASIGKITVIKGDVSIKRGSTVLVAKTGTELEKHDFIATKKNGKVQIVFTDRTIFTVGKNSTLDIADYLYDESKPKKNRAKFNVLKGAFKSITGRIGKLNKSKFRLKTKSASIGIRGTIVVADQDTVMCTSGAITVTTPNGASVRVEAGQKTFVTSGVPSLPVPIAKDDEKQMGVELKAKTTEVSQAKKVTTQDVQKTAQQAVASALVQETQDNEQANEVASALQDKLASESEVKLDGRYIDSKGTTGTVSIDAPNDTAEGLDLSSKGMQAVDDKGNNIETTQGDVITWGNWADDPSKKWVAGTATDVKVLEDMRNSVDKTIQAQYNGQVMGTVNGTDDIKIDSNNKVVMNLNLGAGQNSMDGSIGFNTASGQTWDTTFKGSTTENTFQSNSVAGNVRTDSSAAAIEGGNVQGQFYGDDAQAVGGTFVLQGGKDVATGVFKATK